MSIYTVMIEDVDYVRISIVYEVMSESLLDVIIRCDVLSIALYCIVLEVNHILWYLLRMRVAIIK